MAGIMAISRTLSNRSIELQARDHFRERVPPRHAEK
jgi:hypothetical protein